MFEESRAERRVVPPEKREARLFNGLLPSPDDPEPARRGPGGAARRGAREPLHEQRGEPDRQSFQLLL